MRRLSDEQLGRHLDRRTTSAPLAGAERAELVASIAQQAAAAPQTRRGFDLFARRLLPAAAAMAAVVVVAVLVLQLPRAVTPQVATSPGLSSASTAGPSASAVAATSSASPLASIGTGTKPTPAASVPVTELQWSVEPFLPESGAQPAAITEIGGRLIVTGSDQDGPAAWYSDDDGTTWNGASINDDDDDQRPRALGSVAGSDDLLLSLGSVYLLGNNLPDRRSSLWASTDRGATWERVPGDDVPPRIHDLVAGGPGFVAVGNASPSNIGRPDHGGPPHAAIWLSADGQEWERLPDEESFQLSKIEDIAHREGHLMAVGSHGTNEDLRPAVWDSLDGREWSRTELPASFGVVYAVAEGPDGLVAVGLSGASARGWRATAWLSPDGVSWTSQTLDETAGTVATDVAANRTGFVAIAGSAYILEVDGSGWFVPVGGAASRQTFRAYVYDIAGAEDRFVGVGAGCGPTADCPASHLLVIGRPGIEP